MHTCVQLKMRFLPKSRSHDSEGSVTSDTCGSVSGAAAGTARARIARYGARHTNSQSSPSHRDHASGTHTQEWLGLGDNDDDEDDDDDDNAAAADDVDGVDQRDQSSRLLVCLSDADLKDTRV